MLSVSSLSIQFGGNFLFNDVSFMIERRDRVGLVGKNGAGKSTLMKILTGLQDSEDGSVSRANGMTVGYLPQDGIVALGKTVYDETATAFSEKLALETRINAISDELSSRTDYESEAYTKLIHELSDANDAFTHSGGFSMEGDIERVLRGLGFESDDLTRLTDEFSGGWQMRIELAKILLRKPDYILLDEPTNHLDIESLTWLETFLKDYEGAVVLISHDRAFLDAVTNRTLEITLGKIHDYPAAYSRYVEMRAERRALQMAAYTNQQKEIAETERFIERFRYKATKANQVQSRIKALDKVDRIEIEEEDNSSVKFRFPDAPRSGRLVFEAKDVTKRFGDHTVLRGVNFAVERGDKVAFVGKNGEGKTTFSKMLIGKEDYEVSGSARQSGQASEQSTGGITLGHNVSIGYYAQHQAEMLDPNATVLDIIDRAATGEMRTKIRDLLGAFLFSGDAVYKKVKVLSGGEKSRLALAKLLLEPVNALVLDEPTNHLDMRSKDVLKQALMDYDGSLIVVSHDRDFMQGLTSKVVEFRGGNLKEFDGDIYEFLRLKNLDSLQQLEAKAKPAQKQASTPSPTPSSDAKLNEKIDGKTAGNAGGKPVAAQQAPVQASTSSPNKPANKEQEREQRRLRRAIDDAEKRIATLEADVAALETQMAEPDFYNAANVREKITLHERQRNELDAAMEQWSALQGELDALRS
jgi:ATP-binding cassette, subfamily F, member 3